MDCNFTTIKTCELKDSAFRSRILDFGDFDISDYTFSAVYKAGFDQIISEQEITPVGNILTVPLEAIEGASNRAKVEVWMFRDGGFKDKVIVFDVVISAKGCPSDASITDGVSVTFGGLTVPVEVNQGIVNISREVAFSTLSPDEKLELKGEPFVYEDFTPEQLDNLKGPQGDPLTFSDLTTQQVNELKQPALDAAVIATTAAQNADTAAGLATDATVEAVSATGQAIAATAQAENAAENADEAAVEALAAKDAANTAAANTVMRYNDATETVATDVLTRIDKRTGLPIIYREAEIGTTGTPVNIDKTKLMDDEVIDGFIYIVHDGKYYVNVDFRLNREVYVSSYYKTNFDYVPVPEYRTIAQAFPDVTLAQVQALDPDATLSDSADWYILMWLNKILPINSTLYLTEHYAITRPITWRRSFIKWVGKPFKYSTKHADYQRPTIKQVTAGMDCIAIKDGDGETSTEMGRVTSCDWENIVLAGTKRADLLTGDGISIDVPNGDFLYCNFKRVLIAYHGKSGIRHYRGHVNDINFYDVSTYGNFDTGMYWNGTPQSQTNMFDFEKCSFSINGSIIRNGELVPYDWHIDGDGPDGIYRTTKGGISLGNMSATSFKAVSTQENHGFGILLRDNSSMAGLTLSVYGEGDPLGSLVVLSRLDSDITINSSSVHTYGIYPEVMSPEHWIYASFKSVDHYRKFVQRAGIERNKELTKIPWTQNLITDSKHRKPVVADNVTRNVTYSTDEFGSVITTVEKTGLGNALFVNWLTGADISGGEVKQIPLSLDEGDLVTFALDIRFDYIHDDDKANFAGSQFGVRRYAWGTLSFLSDEDAPTFDGEWKRVHVTYEHKGVYDENVWPQPFIYMNGIHPVTFSVKNPEMRMKTRNQTYSEGVAKASQTLKGIVNQAAAVADSTAVDITEMNTKYNELLAKLRAAGIVAS